MKTNLFKSMLLVLIILLAITLPSYSNLYAFDWGKCRSTFVSGAGEGIFISTTSYVSSTGDCSAVAINTTNKNLFIAQNVVELMEDAAKGQGQYLAYYAQMNQCDIQNYSEKVHRNYSSIFTNANPENIFIKLEKYSCLKKI